MTVRLRAGGATDVGQLRTNNQDSMLVGERVFVVADGMGGHQGGEVASAIATDSVGRLSPTEDITTAELVERVQDANDAVFARSSGDPELSGMGTTLVATALVVEGGEERVAIVNVGDSRAYRLTNGVLEQVSDDHSLVGEMVRDGRISPEQAHDHPQKNIVTRAIGIEPTVEVDEFQLLPYAGDRYLMCSDGLTDEVDEDEIAGVLRTVEDPDEAAADLVRRANENGGRDNITVVIVDVVDDGGAAEAASSAIPDAAGFSHDPGSDTDTLLALPDDMAHTQGSRSASPPDGAPEPRARRQRAVTLRSVAFVVIVLALVGGGIFLSYRSARDYRFEERGGEVTIVRGGWLWIYDDEVAERTDIQVDDLEGQSRIRVDEQRDFATLGEARAAAENLTTTTTTTSTTTTTTSTTTTTGGPTTTAGT